MATEENLMILKMLQDGVLSPEQAAELIKAVETPKAPAAPVAPTPPSPPVAPVPPTPPSPETSNWTTTMMARR